MQYYSYQGYRSTRRPTPPPPAPSSSRRWLTVVVLFAICLCVLSYGGKVAANAMVKEIAKNAENDKAKKEQEAEKKRLAIEARKQKIQAVIDASPSVQISATLLDIKTGEQELYGITEPFVGASTTKVIVASTYLHEVEQGKRSLQDKVGSTTAKSQIQQMINKSNNQSWDALVAKLGRSKLEMYMHNLGLTTYKTGVNVITTADEAQLLKKLYEGSLLNQQNTQLLLSYMQHTNNEELIPPALPTGTTVYHKFGLLGGYLHDAAIIDTGKKSYALVIYTKGTDLSDYKTRTALIQSLTKALLEEVK